MCTFVQAKITKEKTLVLRVAQQSNESLCPSVRPGDYGVLFRVCVQGYYYVRREDWSGFTLNDLRYLTIELYPAYSS